MPTETDVIIIGAGAAGLSATKELSRLGKTSIVVEASHRIGGRAYSEEIAPGVWFDLGCAWLVEGLANPFVPIAEALGITVMQNTCSLFKGENIHYYRSGTALSDEQRATCARYYSDSNSAISIAVKHGRDVPLSDVVDLENEFATPFVGSVASSWGLDLDLVSTADYGSAYGELGFPVVDGYGNLIAAWGADVPVTLNARVERIDWSGRGVKVDTPQGTITGRAALSTVSTGILASGDILFEPGLPDWKLEAIDSLPMGTENKMGVYFDRDVFGEDSHGFYATWNESGSTAKVVAGVMGRNTAAVFVGGRHGVWLEKQGQQACHDFAVEMIADIFGNDIRKHVVRSIVTAWETEPLSRGSWACARPGQAHQRVNLARPVDDRLFFAGEATMTGLQGTCHGAYLSGIQAAQEIATQLNSGTSQT